MSNSEKTFAVKNGEDIKKYLPVDVVWAVTKAYKERL